MRAPVQLFGNDEPVGRVVFGQGERVTSVEWAVRLLGAKLLRSVVLTQELFGSTTTARAPGQPAAAR